MPPERNKSDPQLWDRIQSALDGFRPLLRRDGADIVMVSLSDEGELCVRLTGDHACCPMARATLEAGLADALHGSIAEVTSVRAVR